jgi:hypothetical protein
MGNNGDSNRFGNNNGDSNRFSSCHNSSFFLFYNSTQTESFFNAKFPRIRLFPIPCSPDILPPDNLIL